MRVLVPSSIRDVPDDRVSAYLNLLGVRPPVRPDLRTLRTLHRAHTERVPWTTLDMVLGWDAPADEASCVRRVLGRRAGFCFHLNGAFGWLLDRLGYDVSRHRAGVHTRSRWDAAGVDGSHVTLTVRLGGLGRRTRWLVDVGLGSALHGPVELTEGEVVDGPFQLSLQRSAVVAQGWRLVHDPRADSFVAMEFEHRACSFAQAASRSDELSGVTSPFASRLVAQRRDAAGLDTLVGTRLWRVGAGRRRMRLLGSAQALDEVLQRRFNLDLPRMGLYGAELAGLFEREQARSRASS